MDSFTDVLFYTLYHQLRTYTAGAHGLEGGLLNGVYVRWRVDVIDHTAMSPLGFNAYGLSYRITMYVSNL